MTGLEDPDVLELRRIALPVSVALDYPNRELRSVLQKVGSARVVGLGGTTRKAREFARQQTRIVTHLVSFHGFRGIALEEDWTLCVELDASVRGRQDNLHRLLAQARPFWSTVETMRLLNWVRLWNASHTNDEVRILGLNADATRSSAYDAIAHGCAGKLPDAEAAELAGLLNRLAPTADIQEHARRFRALGSTEQQAVLEEARRIHSLVSRQPLSNSGLLERHALAIVDFYRYHSNSRGDILRYAAARMADHLLWWLEAHDAKVIYLGGAAHTAVASTLTLSNPEITQPNTGSLLRKHLSEGYQSIGFTFSTGRIHSEIPVPDAAFTESVLGRVETPAFIIDPTQARGDCGFFTSPAKIRSVGPLYEPTRDPEFSMTGGSLRDWFDILMHTQTISPTQALSPDDLRTW
ncbi:erythromycin esterase family protein [Embleya sp. NPDC050493]|uniref:erythromycin esterase family protein n=1 Tax=Embleya sp. NPDC050493 TaxID=3363989 RepID=UPI0037AB4549